MTNAQQILVLLFILPFLTCNKKSVSLLPLDIVFRNEIQGIPSDTSVIYHRFDSTQLTRADKTDIAAFLCLRLKSDPVGCSQPETGQMRTLMDIQNLMHHLDYHMAYDQLKVLESRLESSSPYAIRLIYYELLIRCIDQRAVEMRKEDLIQVQETFSTIQWPDPVLNKYSKMLHLYLESEIILLSNAYTEALIPAHAAIALHNQEAGHIRFPELYLDILYLIGKIYSHNEPYPLAESYFRQVLQMTDNAEAERRALLKTNLFFLADLQGKTMMRDSLRLLLNGADTSSQSPKLKYTQQRIFGYYHLLHNNFAKAKDHFSYALTAFDQKDSCNSLQLALLNSIAGIYLAENKIDSALYFNALAFSPYCRHEEMYLEQLWHMTKTRSDVQYALCKMRSDSSFCTPASRYYYDLQYLLDNRFDPSDPHHSDASVYNTETYLDHLIHITHLYKQDSLHREAARVIRTAKSRALIRGLARAERDAILDSDMAYRNVNKELNRLMQITNDLNSPTRSHDSIYLDLYSRYAERRAIESIYHSDIQWPEPQIWESSSDIESAEWISMYDSQVFQYLGTSEFYYGVYLGRDTSALFKIPRSRTDALLDYWAQQLFVSDTLSNELLDSLHALSDLLLHDLIRPGSGPVVFLPDLNLSHFPFEVLADPLADTLKYLFEDHAISYHYDLIELLQQEPRSAEVQNIRVLSWSDAQTIGTASSNVPELPGGYLEGTALCAMAKAQCAMHSGTRLTVRNFESALKADFLHLSTHAYSSALNRRDNYFLLRAGNDAFKYYAYNIPATDTHLKHVVLSACESGTGTYVPGDGVYSISREFIRIGSDVVTKSLWKISDRQTASLLSDYYAELFNGKTAPEALRIAKMKVLDKVGRKAHPRRWAMLICEGDPFLKFRFVAEDN